MAAAAATAPSFSVHLHAGRLDYGGVTLFDGLDLDLPAGLITCLLGPSGIGKTSLLRLIAGLEFSNAGMRLTCGDGGTVASRVAYMAQQDLLLPWLDALGNVTLGERLRGGSVSAAERKRGHDLLALVGLTSHDRDSPVELSGGMRQRVALARTLFEDRSLVLMDEPFSALDAITRAEIQETAARLLAGRTVLLVTHDPLEALRIGHRVLVMNGRPAKIDAPIVPHGAPPRDLADPHLLSLQAELLARLAQAKKAAA